MHLYQNQFQLHVNDAAEEYFRSSENIGKIRWIEGIKALKHWIVSKPIVLHDWYRISEGVWRS